MLCSWNPKSANKLLFVPRPEERYDVFRRPERYFLQPQPQPPLDQTSRQRLLQDVFFTGDSANLPHIEGQLSIKADGKKSWKKHSFVLMNNRLFYKTGKKTEKEIVCLITDVSAHQPYVGVGWKKKFKAPTDHCLALRALTGEQNKTFYLSAESESALFQWLTVARIARLGKTQLMDNYNQILAKMQTGVGKEGIYASFRHEEFDCSEEEETTTTDQLSCCSSEEAAAGAVGGSSSSSLVDSNTSVSSGCISETSSISEENGFDAEFPDGGTIRRRPAQQRSSQQPQQEGEGGGGGGGAGGNVTPTPGHQQQEMSESIMKEALKPLAPLSCANQHGGSDLSLHSLPPPPEELKFPLRYPSMTQQQNTLLPPPPPSLAGQNGSVAVMKSPQEHLQHVRSDSDLAMKEHQRLLPHIRSDSDMQPIREQLYPCGVFRSVFPREQQRSTQMDLLKQMPDVNPPTFGANSINQSGLPQVHQGAKEVAPTHPTASGGRRRIRFHEVVTHINADTSEPLKWDKDSVEASPPSSAPGCWPSSAERNQNPGKLFENNESDSIPPPRAFLHDLQRVMQRKWAVSERFHFGNSSERFADHYNERDVSKWILQSLKHSQTSENINDDEIYGFVLTPHENRPKIYNGRRVPNCFPPTRPPMPPRRSEGTQLTSPR